MFMRYKSHALATVHYSLYSVFNRSHSISFSLLNSMDGNSEYVPSHSTEWVRQAIWWLCVRIDFNMKWLHWESAKRKKNTNTCATSLCVCLYSRVMCIQEYTKIWIRFFYHSFSCFRSQYFIYATISFRYKPELTIIHIDTDTYSSTDKSYFCSN